MVKGFCLFYVRGFDIRDNALDLQLSHLLRSFLFALTFWVRGAARRGLLNHWLGNSVNNLKLNSSRFVAVG
jgi:hypothetical protein